MNAESQEAASIIRREAIIGAIANLAINAGINAWMLAGKGPHLVSVDSIAAKDATVFGSAVPMAVILAVIGATITFFTFRKKAAEKGLVRAALLDRPYFFFGLRHAVAASFVVLGAVVAAGVLWQRLAGTISVTTPVAASLAGIVAGLTSWYASSRTSWALLQEG